MGFPKGTKGLLVYENAYSMAKKMVHVSHQHIYQGLEFNSKFVDGDCGHTIIPKHLVPNGHHHGTVGQPSSGSASTMGAMPAPSTMTSVSSSAKSPWFQGYSTLSTFQFTSLHGRLRSFHSKPSQSPSPPGPRANTNLGKKSWKR